MQTLLAGYRKFRSEVWRPDPQRFAELAKGQQPQTLVISCSDSRVSPTTIFSAQPGELFVVRNVASIVPPYETYAGHHGVSAAIAFAVVNLKVARIVVLGHEHCGGVAAARATGTITTPFVSQWVSLLEPAIHACGHGSDHIAVEQESVRLSVQRLLTFPFIVERMEKDGLQLIGAHFKISDGTLSVLDLPTQEFKQVAD
ncbi:MAG: carbonic anhydrase [Alphaproteobacteria bacterium]|nr:carbonic anhydrase [Alphaproteobacteria bacterium]MDE2266477.1 carbonic anhydrase [Alphaproteobacteria bacterium]